MPPRAWSITILARQASSRPPPLARARRKRIKREPRSDFSRAQNWRLTPISSRRPAASSFAAGGIGKNQGHNAFSKRRGYQCLLAPSAVTRRNRREDRIQRNRTLRGVKRRGYALFSQYRRRDCPRALSRLRAVMFVSSCLAIIVPWRE